VGTDDGKEAIVWIHDLTGTSPTRRLTLEGRNRFPIWSADGQRVAFQSDREGDLGIFWQRADGNGTLERLTRPEQGESHVLNSWSPDGQRFLFSVTKGTSFSLWTLPFRRQDGCTVRCGSVSGSAECRLCTGRPMGSIRVERQDRSEGRAVFVQPFPTTGERRLIAAGGMPLWSRDGKQLFFGETTLATNLSIVSIHDSAESDIRQSDSCAKGRTYDNTRRPNARETGTSPVTKIDRSVLSMLKRRNRRFVSSSTGSRN
jgi:hypothetical protein